MCAQSPARSGIHLGKRISSDKLSMMVIVCVSLPAVVVLGDSVNFPVFQILKSFRMVTLALTLFCIASDILSRREISKTGKRRAAMNLRMNARTSVFK